ncbi:MAG: retropepsin-like aspartic protease [Flavobacteriaceae bacterium]
MTRQSRLIILFFIFSYSIFSQELFRGGEIKEKNYLEIIDFELVNNKIIVPAQINGKTYNFLLDTGAPNAISERLFEELKTEIITKIPIKDANERIDTMRVTSLPNLGLGNFTFENSVALVTDMHNHEFLQCFDIDGFIGSNLFVNTVVKISLTEKKLYITDAVKKLKPSSKGIKLQLIGHQFSPYVKVNIKGKNNQKGTEAVLIDTGMDGLYDISNRAFNIFKEGNFFSKILPSEGTGGIGMFGSAEKGVQYQITIPEFSIGKAVFIEISSYTMNDRNSRIGLDLLQYGDIILDFKKEKFYFENTSEIQLKQPSKVDYTLKDGSLVIDFVWDEQLKNQIQHGDKVLRIDNLNVKDMELCELLGLKQYIKSKNTYEIEVLNNDNQLVTIQF